MIPTFIFEPSRKPQDIPAFNREMLAAFGKERSAAARH
jgi:hypothetical protein